MKKLLALLILIITFNLTAQDQKFSVEINYPLVFERGLEGSTGIIGSSLKYRFKETTSLNLGISYTFDFVTIDYDFTSNEGNYNQFFNHLDLFGELKINGVDKLHPFVGAGYTFLIGESSLVDAYNFIISNPIDDNQIDLNEPKENVHGFNFNIGLQYDISNKLYIHTYYHFIKVFQKSIFNDESFTINFNQLKLGLGIRF